MARRSRGDGSVFYDAARGCWVGSLDLGRDPETRRRVRRKVSAPTKTECRDKLDELRDEYRKAGTVGRRDLTVRQVIDGWMAALPESIASERSVDVYRNAATRICDGGRGVAGIGSIAYARLTPGDVERFLADCVRAGYSASTVKQMQSVGRRAERKARKSGLTSRQAFELAELPRGGRVRKSKSMAADQVAALLALELTPFWRAWIVTAVQTGLRPGEMIGLRWSDVDNAAGVIRVRQTLKRSAEGMVPAGLKTESSRRTLALPAMTAAVLERQRRAQAAERLKAAAWTDMDLVFAGPAGRGRWLQDVNRELKLLCKQAGMGTDWQLRETRHTFVSVLSDAGVDIDRIADAVGHVNSTITRQVYRHMISDKVTETASVMDRLFPQDGAR